MRKTTSRKPPSGAPEGTTWFGGPVDRWKVALRVYGEELDPDEVSALLRCEPSSTQRKGDPCPKRGRWVLQIDSTEYDDDADLEAGLRMLLAQLPSDPGVWATLTDQYAVDVFCALHLASANRGFGISPEVSRLLSDRNLTIGFDVYCDAPKPASA